MRMVVDPNSFARRDPQLSVCTFDDLDHIPALGERVLAVQPDDDGMDGVADAVVTGVSWKHELIYVRVNWSTFREVPSGSSHGRSVATQDEPQA